MGGDSVPLCGGIVRLTSSDSGNEVIFFILNLSSFLLQHHRHGEADIR